MTELEFWRYIFLSEIEIKAVQKSVKGDSAV
jgi:hypothetical protein